MRWPVANEKASEATYVNAETEFALHSYNDPLTQRLIPTSAALVSP
jgi:hypothetical protein